MCRIYDYWYGVCGFGIGILSYKFDTVKSFGWKREFMFFVWGDSRLESAARIAFVAGI